MFCKIVAGDIPATLVHESETTVAFRDLNPQAPTHVLVIPRSHYPDAATLAQSEPATAAHLFDAAREIAAAEGLDGADGGYRMVFNTGAGRAPDRLPRAPARAGRALDDLAARLVAQSAWKSRITANRTGRPKTTSRNQAVTRW